MDRGLSTVDYHYYHPDHIGSSNVVTDKDGNIAQLLEYDPYGLTNREEGSYNTDCRFTGKLFDTSSELYYYGARYYDPDLGRFIQPDTIVPYPSDPQSFNRYAYARNNPIRYVDPSGHIFGIDDLIIGIVVGAIIGAVTAAVTGGDIWMGVATGAVGGALFSAVGFTGVGGLAHTLGHATAGALSGSISSVMSGGDAFQGALIGAFSAGASEWMGTNVPFLKDTGGRNFGDYLGNVTRRALIGGTVGGMTSYATGGDFWQGAALGASTSAIAYTANDWMHKSGVISGIKKFYRGIADFVAPNFGDPTSLGRNFWLNVYEDPPVIGVSHTIMGQTTSLTTKGAEVGIDPTALYSLSVDVVSWEPESRTEVGLSASYYSAGYYPFEEGDVKPWAFHFGWGKGPSGPYVSQNLYGVNW